MIVFDNITRTYNAEKGRKLLFFSSGLDFIIKKV